MLQKKIIRITPATSFDVGLKDFDVYFVHDHLTCIKETKGNKTVEDWQDSLKYRFKTQNINQSEKLFLFDHYFWLHGYENNGIYVAELPLLLHETYLSEMPKFDLDFKNKNIILNCQMNKQRHPRIIASAWLKNNLFEKVNFVYSQSWELSDSLKSFLHGTFKKYHLNLNSDLLPKKWFAYKNFTPDQYGPNEEVFNRCLNKQFFNPSIFSIVLEPIEYELGCMFTEKYFNAVYGGTIPIVYGYKIYDVLNKMGFDTFSDIINTDSQYEQDPYLRVITLFENNKHLFNENSFKIINSKEIQTRINHNLTILRDTKKFFDAILKINNDNLVKEYITLNIDRDNYGQKFNNLIKGYYD